MARLRLSLNRFFIRALSLSKGGATYFFAWMFSRENIWAFILFLILVALVIFSADASPLWIYQGF